MIRISLGSFPNTYHKPMNKPGVVLITTLLIVMIMSVLSIQISKTFMLSLQREGFMNFSNSSYHLLLSAESRSVKQLKQEMALYKNKLLKSDSLLIDNLYFEVDSLVLEIEIDDKGNCFNLNSIFNPRQGKYEINKKNYEWLKRFLRAKLFDELEIESFVDQLIDWVDRDSQPRNYGAEDYFYLGPSSRVQQYTPKRFLTNLSELKNFPIVSRLDFSVLTKGMCVFPFTNIQTINVNTLKPDDVLLLATFFNENNYEYVEGRIIDFPKGGYNLVNDFTKNFPDTLEYPSNVLDVTSKIFSIKSMLIEEDFFAELETLVILDASNKSKVLNRHFNL